MSAALDWDYSALAGHYRHRAPYAEAALSRLFAMLALPPGTSAIDIGAGTGRFTAALVAQGYAVTAVEPNAAMREIGRRAVPVACWLDARGEATRLDSARHDLVAFASSFNVLAAPLALAEAARLLKSGGWLVCLWNHRDLDDPLQRELQAIIEREVPGYAHGTRREDPSDAIRADGDFDEPCRLDGAMRHAIDTRDFVEGFRAHATLIRQAGPKLPLVLDALATRLAGNPRLSVPFVTRIFAARRKPT